MQGLMQQQPLLISSLIEHAETFHGDTEIVSVLPEGSQHRTTWKQIGRRARQLANALSTLGVGSADRVATLAWNTHRHLEMYFAVSGSGAVLHTVNPRLFQEQIEYIVNHAEDQYVFFDISFSALIEKIAPSCPTVRGFIAMTDRAHMPDIAVPKLLCYEELIAAASRDYAWPAFDENAASSLCYTSGTTGNPKGVLYSHRSTVLHSFAACSTDGLALSARDSVLLIVPLFHVNAWGVPYAAAMCGAKLVLPGPSLDGASIYRLLAGEQCNFSLGVPTVWLGFFDHVERHPEEVDLSLIRLERVVVGGSAAPRAMIEKFDTLFGAFLIHAWGMTEISPLGTVGMPLPKNANLPAAARYDLQAKQGRAIFGVGIKIVGEHGESLPHDGKAFGDLKVRGPWIVENYYRADEPTQLDNGGWFATGDIATIDADGYIQLTDRSKDVIKSGGEWISSIDLENAALGHPAVQEAAVIGVAHSRWQERPLMLVIRKPGQSLEQAELLDFLTQKVARWWIPDEVLFVDSLPHTATGKLQKMALRRTYQGHRLATDRAA